MKANGKALMATSKLSMWEGIAGRFHTQAAADPQENDFFRITRTYIAEASLHYSSVVDVAHGCRGKVERSTESQQQHSEKEIAK